MTRRVAVLVAVVALATVAITALLGGERSASLTLPTPQAVAVSSLPSPTKAVAPGLSSDPGTQTTTFTTVPPATITACTVAVSNPHPLRGQTAETVTVSTTAGAQVRLEADYARVRSVHGGQAGASGQVTFSLPITHAPVGVAVNVLATAVLRGVHVSCQSSFEPVG
jgi:hypothetical protein